MNVPGWMQEARNIALGKAGMVSWILEVTSAKYNCACMCMHVCVCLEV